MNPIKEQLQQRNGKVVSVSTILGNVLIWPFVFLNLYFDKIALFSLALGFLLAVNLVYLLYRKTKSFHVWSTSVIVILGLALALVFADGGLQETGHLWVFVFPLLAFELKGPGKGAKYIVSFYLFLGVIYLIGRYFGFTPAYQTPLFMFVFFVVLLALTAFLYSYQRLKNKNEINLRQSKEKYEALFNDLSLGVIMLDRNFQIVEANNTMKDWFPDLKNSSSGLCYDLFHPDGQGKVCSGCPVENCFKSGVTSVLEQKKNTSEGVKFYRLTANPMKDAQGGVYAVIETLEDITEQKNIQIELSKREETFRSLVSSLSDIVYTLDKDQKLTGVYGNWATTMGLTPEFFLGKTTEEIFGTEAASLHQKANKRALEGEVVVYEWSVEKDGSVLYYQTSVSPLRDHEGNITGLVGVGRDISVLKSYENALKESEQRFRTLTGNSSAGIYLYQDSRFLMVNPAIVQITGYSEEELMEMNQLEVVHPEQREEVLGIARKRLNGDNSQPDRYEMRLNTRSGKTCWVDHSVALIRYNNKPATIGTIYDISEIRAAREKIAFQHDFFKMVAAISGSFINVNDDTLDEKINSMLKDCGRFLGVDRTFLFQFSKDLQYMSNTHEWCADGIAPSIQDLQDYPLAETPWIQQILLNREMLFVPDVDALPDEYQQDREELQRQQIQSVLCLPVIKNNDVIGYFGFDAVKQKRLLDEQQVNLMKVLANTLGEALVKVKTEKDMQLMNERYDQLSSQTRSMTFEIDSNGLYTAISPVVKDLLGYEPEEVIGKMHFIDFFPPAQREAFAQEIFEQLKTREPVTNYVNQLITKDGETVWVSTNSLPLFNDKNELTGYWGIDRDITEQTMLSEAIKYQSSLQELVSEISRLFVSADSHNMDKLVGEALEKAGEFFRVSRTFVYRFKPDGKNYKLAFEWCAPGVDPTPEEIRKETSFRDFPWWFSQISQNKTVLIADTDQMPAEATKEKQALRSMNVKSLVSFPVADKEVITGFLSFDTYYHKANWTNEQLAAMQLIAKILSDALERNKAEQALIHSEKINRETALRYQTYIDASNTGGWEYTRSKGYLWCSPQYFKMLGRDISDFDFSGKPNAEIIWKELIHPDDLLQGKGMLHFYLENPQGTYQQTFRMLHKDGQYRWILSRGRILTDEKGNNTDVFIGTHIDITHQKNNEEAILAKNKELESYLYVASHDLRAPLVNIQGFSNRIQKQIGQLDSLILQENNLDNRGEKIDTLLKNGLPQSLSFILSNVQKMDSLINGLLAISRTGRVKMNISEVNVHTLFQKLVESFNYQIEVVRAQVSVGELLPCYGDYQLLQQLFSNLFDNALKYHNPEKRLHIGVQSEKKGSDVIYRIEDTGIGISQRDINKIWDVFYQVDPTAKQRGDGIGLNLVQKIVEKHKGAIRVESTEGEGSTFIVQLPARLFIP